MKKRLVSKIQLRVISTLSISLIILGLILSVCGKEFLKTQRAEMIEKEVYPIAAEITNYIRAQENTSLSNLQKTLDIVSECSNSNIIVTDNLGYPYAASNAGERDNELRLSDKMISDKEREKLKGGSIVEKSEEDGKYGYVYMKPVFHQDYFEGILIFKVSTKPMEVRLGTLLLSIWICIFVSIFTMLVSIKYFINKMIVKPIDEINRVARKIAVGEVEKRVLLSNDDEIGDLAKSFNLMAESLNEIDKDRRDFISNASHELRSPITSIRGFIAGIIDGIIPKDKEKYYLSIVYDEVKRLSKLVEDLLDISTLDNSRYKLDICENDINGILKTCLAKLETRIIDKDLKVEVVLDNNHEFVFIDRDRIIQVIINLLDNAVKYSNAGETIRVESKVKGKKVYISVENTGLELSEEQVKKVWDRFYKSDSSRTNKESTGLGLSIVRSILTKHGEDIWIESNKGKTIFTFTLTRVL